MKSPVASKTLWLNGIILIAGVIGFIAGHEVIVDYPQAAAAMLAIQGALNIVLRFMTSQPIVE
jgi:hypothetical protein